MLRALIKRQPYSFKFIKFLSYDKLSGKLLFFSKGWLFNLLQITLFEWNFDILRSFSN